MDECIMLLDYMDEWVNKWLILEKKNHIWISGQFGP